jgi:hypothetical protein
MERRRNPGRSRIAPSSMTDETISAVLTTPLRMPWPNDPWMEGHAHAGKSCDLMVLEVETRGGIVYST